MSDLPQITYLPPEYLTEELKSLHASIIEQLRSEAAHVQLSTIQELLLERIATFYVLLRWKEGLTLDGKSVGGLDNDDDRRQVTFWLTMTREFTAQVRAAPQVDPEDAYKARFMHVIELALHGMHEDVAGPLREKFGLALAEAGL